jgi:hypothetical protein
VDVNEEPDDEAEASPDELATFMALLDRVEDALAAVSEEDDRRMIAQILRDAARIESQTEGGAMTDDETWTRIEGKLAESTLAMFKDRGHDIIGAHVEVGKGTRTKNSDGTESKYTPLRLVYSERNKTAGVPDEQ